MGSVRGFRGIRGAMGDNVIVGIVRGGERNKECRVYGQKEERGVFV